MQTPLLRFAVPGAVGVFRRAEVTGNKTMARKWKGPTTGVTSADRDGRRILRSVDGGTAQTHVDCSPTRRPSSTA
eukprot:6044323-Amphidinium_carterae.1